MSDIPAAAPLAQEVPVEILANGSLVSTLLCSLNNLDDLAVGHLVGRGMIKDPSRLVSVGACADLRMANVIAPGAIGEDRYGLGQVVASGCGSGPGFRTRQAMETVSGRSPLPLPLLRHYARRMFEAAEEYRRTGGMHCAALLLPPAELPDPLPAHPDWPFVVREDVGRHNAVDKALGYGFRHGWDLRQALLLTSGRIAADMILKAIAAGISVLVSRSIPTTSAYELAQASGLCLLGRIEKPQVHVYGDPTRVLLD